MTPHTIILITELDDYLTLFINDADRLAYLSGLRSFWQNRRRLHIETKGESELMLLPQHQMELPEIATVLMAIIIRRTPLESRAASRWLHQADNVLDLTSRLSRPMTAMEAWC